MGGRCQAPKMAVEKDFGLTVVVLGGLGDRIKSKRLRETTPGRMIDLTGRTTLSESAAVLAGASLVIGVDTGLTHMGVAFERSTVALFGATRPYLDADTPKARVLYHPYPCSPCRRRPTCDRRFPCMAAIETDEVLQAARRILDRSMSSER